MFINSARFLYSFSVFLWNFKQNVCYIKFSLFFLSLYLNFIFRFWHTRIDFRREIRKLWGTFSHWIDITITNFAFLWTNNQQKKKVPFVSRLFERVFNFILMWFHYRLTLFVIGYTYYCLVLWYTLLLLLLLFVDINRRCLNISTPTLQTHFTLQDIDRKKREKKKSIQTQYLSCKTIKKNYIQQ